MIGLVHVLYSGDNFADHYSYLFYVDRLYFVEGFDSLLLEPFSKGMLLVLRLLTGNTDSAVNGAHYVISAIYLIGTLAIFPPREANWRGMLVAFAIFGPQLAFVTLRATGAYFFVAAGTLWVLRNQVKGLWLGGVAVLFHVSAALAVPPIAVLLMARRSRRLAWLQRPAMLIRIILLFFVLLAFGGSSIIAAAKTLFQAVPYLSKYISFLQEDGAGRTAGLSQFAGAHFVFLAALSAFVIAFLAIPDRRTRAASVFVLVSYGIYLFIFFGFSPIAAFRQTPFWMLPAVAIFPWQRIGWRGLATPVFCGAMAGIFVFQFSRVLAL